MAWSASSSACANASRPSSRSASTSSASLARTANDLRVLLLRGPSPGRARSPRERAFNGGEDAARRGDGKDVLHAVVSEVRADDGEACQAALEGSELPRGVL